MFSKNNAERFLIRRSVNLSVVRRREWLNKCIPVLLMFDDDRSKVHKNGSIELFGMATRLFIIRCCCQAFNTEEGASLEEAFADELGTIVSEDGRCWDALRD